MRISRRRVFAVPVVITLATGGACNTVSNPPGTGLPDAPIDTPPIVTENPPPPTFLIQEASPPAPLNDVWGSGAADIYAVGDGGTILHSTGNGVWTAQVSTVNVDLYSVWGSGPTDIYVGGFGDTLLHSTGNGVWTKQTIPNLGVTAIGGTGPNDIYIMYANSAGQVHHSTGNGTWTPVTIGVATSIISANWSTYFAGGTDPNASKPYILHGATNPTTETMPVLPDSLLRNIFAMWGSSETDLYAVGNGNTILHSLGTGAWTLQAGPLATASYIDVWGSGPQDLYVVGNTVEAFLHSYGDGNWYNEYMPVPHPAAIWGTNAYDVYVVGDQIAHKNY